MANGLRLFCCLWCGMTIERETDPAFSGIPGVIHRPTNRFCSQRCITSYNKDFDGKLEKLEDLTARMRAASCYESDLDAAQRAKAGQPRLVWCNRCVAQVLFRPTLDGSQHPSCGYRLSVYGPFDEQPSWSSSTLLGRQGHLKTSLIGSVHPRAR